MKKIIIICLLLICVCLCSCDVLNDNSTDTEAIPNAQPTETDTETISETGVETTTEIEYSIKTVEELEDFISLEYKLENFKLSQIIVGVCDCISDSKEIMYDCTLLVAGKYGENQEMKWEKYFSITKDVFQSLYDLHNDYVVYNSEITPVYDSLVTNIPQSAINRICNIIF